ncbi:putative toxin-antitoxin system toxin component, PIN family [Prosthecobacter sp.]|jgi:putative PIN family toxin of toxin-antitoxin system|uniref:putative toxin-antitoxin system toxin component, PIN family n=1 Tax=Prosthecobacter sp. TaxID=1965333 RepID=UPI0037CC51A2
MRVVLDTNVILQARAAGHPYHAILQAWLNRRFSLVVSTEIMLEYEEVITERAGAARWSILEKLLDISDNVVRVSPSYRFRLIPGDLDDNKFADGAVVADAEYIVTADNHFKAMHGSGFKPQVLTPEAFMTLL